jgi:hypothetical protein
MLDWQGWYAAVARQVFFGMKAALERGHKQAAACQFRQDMRGNYQAS